MTTVGLAGEPDLGDDDSPATEPALVERVRRSIVVEDAIRTRVLPRYANTHIESSGTGRHTTRLREQARQLIHQAGRGYLGIKPGWVRLSFNYFITDASATT